MKTLRFALLPIAFIVACGGSSEFGKRSGRSIALDALPEAYAGALCDLFQRCAGLYYDLAFASENCSTVLTQQARQGGFPEIEQAVEEERVAYDPKSAAKCITALDTVECRNVNARPIEDCENMFKGNVALGDACDIDEECTGALICDKSMTCPGQCRARGDAGTGCQANDDCASGLVCSTATTLCAEPAQDGGACEGGTEPQCDGGLACVGQNEEMGVPGTCRPFEDLEGMRRAAGQACNPDTAELCEGGLSCVVSSIEGPVFTCRAVPAPGGSCNLGFPENCPTGEYCPLTLEDLVTGTLEASCTPLPRVGDACTAHPLDLSACEAYSRCDIDIDGTGTCIALRNLGESCNSPDVCYSANCVNGGCQPPGVCP